MKTSPMGRSALGFGRSGWWSAIVVVAIGSAWLFGQTPGGAGSPGGPETPRTSGVPTVTSTPPGAPAATPPSGGAATPSAPSAPGGRIALSPSGELPPVIDLFKTEPVVNSIILVLSVVSVALFIYFLLTIRLSAMMPADLMDDILKLIVRRNYDAAIQICRSHRNIFAAGIVRRAIENHDKSYSTLIDIIDAEGRRRADLLWNRISYLVDLSTVAPMLGLVGTVLGMLKAFFILPEGSRAANSAMLARAIGGAMTATLLGISVAVIAVVFYTIIRARATRALAAIEEAAHYVADQLKRGPEASTEAAGDGERTTALSKRGVE